jgi:D-serine deaminase-like pyridoxal phosphate-dependent protein
MSNLYAIDDTQDIYSPGLVIFRDLLERNLDEMIRLAHGPQHLRPHCKTHKIREITEIQLARGITKHKCATLAEAEMLADAGVKDIFLAYNPVGPNIGRVVRFCQKFWDVELSVSGDHPRPVAELGGAAEAAGVTVEVVLDLDMGMHRTGIALGEAARKLYEQIANTPGLKPGGLHIYDGHQSAKDLEERRRAVLAAWEPVRRFRDELVAAGLPVPRIVAGGTSTFPVYAELDDPSLELSAGTTVLHDVGYRTMYPELNFTPAALVLTRVISRPGPGRLTCDLGYKAIASDPPAGSRLEIIGLPDAKCVLQNEEHLVIESAEADRYQPGDELLAIPRHICPTCALHQQAYVVANGKLVGTWRVASRDRMLTI